MAFYLQKGSAFTDATIEIPNSSEVISPFFVDTGAATQVSYDIEFEAKVDGTDWVVSSNANLTTRLIFLKSDDTIELRESSQTFATAVPSGVSVFHVFRYEYRETDDGVGGYDRIVTLFIDGVQADTYDFGGSRPLLNEFFRLFTLGSSTRHGSLKYYAYTDNLNASNNLYFDADASGGTGTVLPETTGNGTDAPQVGTWPGDDSEWVFFSTGPTITSVDSDDIITDGQTAISIVGTEFDTVTVAEIRTSDGTYTSDVFASFTSSSTTSATFDHTRGDTPLSTSSYQLQLLLGNGTDSNTHNITINPASGEQVIELSGTVVITDPESAFAPYTGPDPVVGDQYIVPDATTEGAPITANANSTLEYDYSAIDPVPVDDTHAVEWWSSDGTSRVWSSGTITVGSAPAGTVTIGTITVNETTADVPFTYDATDQDSFEYRLDGGTWTTSTSPINLTGLTADTTYMIEVKAVNSYGDSTIASKSFTTDAAASPPAGTITFGTTSTTGSSATIPFTYDAADETGFEYRVDGGAWNSIAASPVELTGLTTNTTYTVSVRAVNNDGPGTTYSTSVTTDAALAPPAGTVTFGAPSVTQDTISQPFTYDDTDQTGFEYRVNGGAWVALASSPVSLTGLSTGTTYQIEVRAVNNDGEGSIASTNVATEGLNPPQGVITFGTISTTTDAATVPFTYDLDDETGFEYSLDGGPFTVTTSPVGLTGLDPATSYNLEVRAVNADGPGTAYPTTFTTDALAPPQGVITFGTPTVGQTSVTVPFTYSATDQTGFEYQVDSGSFIALGASPVSLTALTPDTTYNVTVRAVNNEGSGTGETLSITTLAEQSSTPGQTSGTYAFNMQVDEIIEDAYERIGQESVSGYDLRTARRSLNILLTEWVNKEITLWTMERRSIQCVAGQAEYALRERDVDVFEVAVRTSGADLVLSRVSWDQSMYTADKTQSGRPIQYKFDRQITPKLVLWPVPDTSTLSLVVDVFKYIEDVGDYFNVIGAPRRFLPAMIAGLAYYLAEKKAPSMVAQKKQMYDEALMYALNADEEVKSFTVRPSRGRYRRR